jgi:thiamine-phosphate diphosphorylase
MALDLACDGIHVGQNDGIISQIKKIAPENFIIGASCYDSKHLAMEAGEQGADYVSFGTFFPSTTKWKNRPNIAMFGLRFFHSVMIFALHFNGKHGPGEANQH